jgi:hypothetical protein
MKLSKVHAIALRYILAMEQALLMDDWTRLREHALQLAEYAATRIKPKK